MHSIEEKAAVGWTMLNNYDRFKGKYNLIQITEKCLYKGYKEYHPSDKYHTLAYDIAMRYSLEKLGYSNIGRIIPKEYCSFWGKNRQIHFRVTTGIYEYWDFSLQSPYS